MKEFENLIDAIAESIAVKVIAHLNTLTTPEARAAKAVETKRPPAIKKPTVVTPAAGETSPHPTRATDIVHALALKYIQEVEKLGYIKPGADTTPLVTEVQGAIAQLVGSNTEKYVAVGYTGPIDVRSLNILETNNLYNHSAETLEVALNRYGHLLNPQA